MHEVRSQQVACDLTARAPGRYPFPSVRGGVHAYCVVPWESKHAVLTRRICAVQLVRLFCAAPTSISNCSSGPGREQQQFALQGRLARVELEGLLSGAFTFGGAEQSRAVAALRRAGPELKIEYTLVMA